MQWIAVYVRVSTQKQTTKSQEPDLTQWIDAYANGQHLKWYRDKATGKTMDRPGWNRLEADMRAGKVATLVCWRLDRLGRTASGLTALFEELTARKVNLVSLKDGVDLSTPTGRMIANVLASMAAYETEVRGERIAAGQAVARANGKTWGGSQRGRRIKVKPEQERLVRQMKAAGEKVAVIARAVSLSRPTIYALLAESSG